MTATQQGEAVFPPGIDGGALLRATRHNAWTMPGGWGWHDGEALPGTAYRRAITAPSPLLFAVTYLGRYLRGQHDGRMSFSPFHLELCAAARRWPAPAPVRDVWVAPRGAAKTTWLFLALPLWALAHGHRRSFLAFSLTAEQAELHLANLRAELAENDLLRADFPELAPRRGANTKRTILTGGASIAARGLGGAVLGFRQGAERPDLIVGDDLEPDAADHTPAARDKILSRVTDSILPMGARHTVVQIAGTTTMHGSLIHDAVRAALGERTAPWISQHGFRPRYFPPVLDDEHGRRSLWPQRWSLEELDEQRRRHPQSYALNMANRPEQAGARGYWSRELIRYNPRRTIVRRVLYADVAMTQRARSDQTALVLVGVTADGRHAVVEHAELARLEGLALRERMWAITGAYPGTLREWVVEGNQGADRWREILAPVPEGVTLDLEHVRGHKADRIQVALRHYQRRAVEHAAPLTALEEQMLAWTPAASADDGLDALAGALRRVFPGA